MAGRGPARPLAAAPVDRDDMLTRARERCLALLTARARSRAELAEALARAHCPDDVAAEVLDRLSEVGLVDDTAYAEAYVRTGHQVRGRGRRALVSELRGRGVAAEVVEAALAGVDDEAEREAALRLAQRRVARLAGLDEAAVRRRLTAFLARRGYDVEIVGRVVDEVTAWRP